MIKILSLRSKLLTLCALGLSACGNSDAQSLGQIAGAIATQITSDAPDADDVRAQLTPAVVAAVEEPFLLVSLPARDASATFRLFANIDGRTDWRGSDGISVVTAQDIVVATRGLGADLFLAEAAGLRNALAIGSGTIARHHSHLDGENREIVQQYQCNVSVAGVETVDLIARIVATRRIDEACQPTGRDGEAFTNNYWIGIDDGLIWQSNQWISDDIAYIMIQHLKR